MFGFISRKALARERDAARLRELEEQVHELTDRLKDAADDAAAAEAEAAAERRELVKEIVALNRALGKVESRAAQAERQHAVAVNNFEWARLRMNELERERAMLYTRVLNVNLAAFQLERQETEAPAPPNGEAPAASPTPGEPLGIGVPSAGMFEDLGDEVAERLGIRRDAGGVLAE